MTTDQQATILAQIVTRDEAGRHFTEVYATDDLMELEHEGLIEIARPVHDATGIRYQQEYWSVNVTQEGQALVDACPECWPTE